MFRTEGSERIEDMAERIIEAGAPDVIEVGGHLVLAPGFTPRDFDRAIYRAHNENIRIEPSDMPAYVLAVNPNSGATYTVSRSSCTCLAGRKGNACKHRALAIFLADVTKELDRTAA